VARDASSDSGSSPPEPFVSAEEGARFLSVSRRYLLDLARNGLAGAYALRTGTQRKFWVFRLSELANAITKSNRPGRPKSQECGTIPVGQSPR
jgi:hypothetical protein